MSHGHKTLSYLQKKSSGKILQFILFFPVICLFYLLVWPVEIDPVAWESPAPPAMEGNYQPNAFLKNINVLGAHKGPEDIVFDKDNCNMYAGYHDGIIRRISSTNLYETGWECLSDETKTRLGTGNFLPTTGSAKKHRNIAGYWDYNGNYYLDNEVFFYDTKGRPLGMAIDSNNNLIVADAVKGLIAINQEGVATTLSTKSDSDGIPMKFTDDLDIASDGKIYFSDASSVYSIGEDRLDLMEHRPHGRLLVYDPQTKKTTTLMNNLYFANGVAVAPDDSFVLVNETYMYRIHKYWLKGDKAGTSEIIIDNLPGFPDNISSNGEGIYWVALFTIRNDFLEQTADKPFLRKLALRLPEFLQPQPEPYAFVLGINDNGKVIHNLQYGAEDAYSPITSVKEYGDFLFFGSLTHAGFGRIKTPKLKVPYSE